MAIQQHGDVVAHARGDYRPRLFENGSDFDVVAVFDWKTGGQVRAAGRLRREVDDAAQVQLRRDGRSDVRDAAQKYACRKQAFDKTRHAN